MRNRTHPSSLDETDARLRARANSIDATPRLGFKDALRLRVREAFGARTRMMTPLRFAAIFSPVLAVVVIAVLLVQPFFGVRTAYAADQFTLVPYESDANGVEPGTKFLLESREPVSISDIEELLSVEAEGAPTFSLEQISETRIAVSFDGALTPDDMVKFHLPTTTTWPNGETAERNYNWAFQVKGDFRVASTLPGDRMSDVPLDTGIEFTLSHENVDQTAFERALTIVPPIAGHVESSRRMFVFVPDEPLLPRTTYAVTLSGDLPLKGGEETLGDDVSFSFETSIDWERGYWWNVGERYLNVTPDDSVALTYWDQGNPNGQDTPVRVKLYRYDSFEAYVAALKAAQDLDWREAVTADDLIDTSGAQPVLEFDAERAQYDYQNYVVFPSSLPEGYYVADLQRNGVRAWSMIASSNLTAYVSRATDKTLFWVNDAATDQPVHGADVKYLGDDEHGTVGATGLGTVPSREDQSNVVEIRFGAAATAIVLQSSYLVEGKGGTQWDLRPIGSGISDAYWTYVYTDRPTYKPTDTMQLWGYVEARQDGARPEALRVDIGYDAQTVDVTPNGTYAATFELRGVDAGSFPINVYWGDQLVASRTVSVTEYVKPAYTLSIETDVDAAWVGDTVGYTVHGEFFEGTPVKGLEVSVSGECLDQTVTLDDTGNARGSFVCPESEGQHGPRSAWLSVRPARPEEGQIEAGTNVMVFGPKIYLDPSWEGSVVKDGTGTVQATVRNVQAVNSWDPLVFGPTARAGQAVTGTVTEITYTRVEVGRSYDFVRKQTVVNYRYDRNERTLEEFTAYSDANGVMTHAFAAVNPDANYRVDLSTSDENGKRDRVEVYLWARQDFEYGPSNALTFHNDDAATDEDQWSFPGYDVGDTVHLSIRQNFRAFDPEDGGRFLYYQAQRGIRETEVSDDPTYVFPFEQKDVPNVAVYGVYYVDGAYQQVSQMGWWYGTSGYAVTYDQSLSELTVSLTADEARYAPGEEATVNVHVQDAGGRPVQAEVNLNVVDEAYYAIFPEDVDPLGGLYRWVDDGVQLTQVTQDGDLASAMGAEKGGGGERPLGRFTFKDNAAFAIVQTDGSGNGSMTFTLPDNITAWRVTGQALNADEKLAGDAKISLDASLPFFLSPVMRETYLDDDRPTVLVRAAGTAVGLGDTVEYEVRVPDADVETAFTLTAGETARIELPELALGTHNVTIAAKTGTLADTVTRQVTIVPSRLLKPVIASVDGGVGPNTVVEGADDRYTRVTFMDGGLGRYYGELQALSGWWGDRTDETLARVGATELLNAYFDEDHAIPAIDTEALTGDGVRLLPYGDGDFALTARVALLGENTVFSNAARAYFQMRLDDRILLNSDAVGLTPRERAMAFAALASLGEPVLAEFQRLAPELGDDVDVRLWVALGLHGAGDDEGARAVYRDLVTNEATERTGYIYLPGDDVETTMERTALLAVLAGALNEPQRDAIHDYVVSQSADNTVVPLERLLYVKETLPNLIGGETVFAYTLRGERAIETLANGETRTVLAAPEDLSRFAFEVTRGSLMIVSRYDTPLVDPDAPVDAALGVTRTYGVGEAQATTFNENDLVRVRLAFTLPPSNCTGAGDGSIPCETYEITDIVPSGLSPITPAGFGYLESDAKNCVDYPAIAEDQRVSFFVSAHTQTACNDRAFSYYARVVTPGTYLAEPAYIRSTRDPERNNHSNAVLVTINP